MDERLEKIQSIAGMTQDLELAKLRAISGELEQVEKHIADLRSQTKQQGVELEIQDIGTYTKWIQWTNQKAVELNQERARKRVEFEQQKSIVQKATGRKNVLHKLVAQERKRRK
ncbi:hypothetical protein ACFE33_15040 [Falsihalocynthiibacter sp. SS001]|uniref:hypothetical protein n=1 Tax=Falsihalocynthiibacter sp. SS001 TaxID=3349698 RepID=UPI0036D2A853